MRSGVFPLGTSMVEHTERDTRLDREPGEKSPFLPEDQVCGAY